MRLSQAARSTITIVMVLALLVALAGAEAWDQSGTMPSSGNSPAAAPATGDSLEPALHLLKDQRFEAAEAAARDYLEGHLNSAEGHFLLGLVLFREAKAQESLAEYTSGARFKTPSATDLKVVGLDYVLLDDYLDANKWLLESTARNPSDAIAWYSLGRVQYKLNRVVEAAQSFQKTLELDSHNVKAEDNLGLALEALNKPDDAIAAYRLAIAWQADAEQPNEQPFLNLGILLMTRNELPEATALLERAVKLAPKDPKIHEQLGRAYLLQGNVHAAASHLEQAVALSPEDPRLHFQLGQAYRKLGMTEKAKTEFERTEALNGTRASKP